LKHLLGILFVVVVVLALGSSPACADTVFSNLGTGSTYALTAEIPVLQSQDIAGTFTVAAGTSFNLTQLDIGLTDAGDSAIVELLTNSAGLPGTVIQSWTLTNLPVVSAVNSIQPSQTISGITGIVLSGGTQYWLAAFPGTSGTQDFWNFSLTSQNDPLAVSGDGGGSWLQLLNLKPPGVAFDVQGTPISSVPEPSTVVLLAAGLLTVMLLTTWKRSIA
jgi:hypothetical protein